jgi:hypothetical protein
MHLEPRAAMCPWIPTSSLRHFGRLCIAFDASMSGTPSDVWVEMSQILGPMLRGRGVVRDDAYVALLEPNFESDEVSPPPMPTRSMLQNGGPS